MHAYVTRVYFKPVHIPKSYSSGPFKTIARRGFAQHVGFGMAVSEALNARILQLAAFRHNDSDIQVLAT